MGWPKVERHAQPLSDASQHPNITNVGDARGLDHDLTISIVYSTDECEP